MRRWIYVLISLVALVGVGCKSEKPIPVPENVLKVEYEQSVVRLNNTKDSFTVRFTTPYDWRISTTSRNFTISPMQGTGSSEPQSITITAASENVSTTAVRRGYLDICIDKYSVKHQIEVVQCAASERTLFAWLMGTSLSYHFSKNIDCMKQAVAGDILGNDRLLIFEQLSRSQGVMKELYYDPSTQECAECAICEVEIPTTLTAEGVTALMRQMKHIAPAEHYALMFGGHATAWLPASPSSGGIELSVGEHYIPNWNPVAGAETTRTIGENNVKIMVEELAEGLSATGTKFDWIYFDMCFMSSLEAGYALRHNTDYIIGSPCEIMGYGAPYDVILPELCEDDLDGACRAFRDFYANDYYGSKSGCMATIVTKELDALAAAYKTLNERALSSDLDILAVQPYEGRDSYIFFDAEHYVLNAYDDDAGVTAFCQQLDKSVINRYHTEKFYSAYNAQMNNIVHYSGVSISPDEGCIDVVEVQVATLRQQVATCKEELDNLRDKLYDEGIDPDDSEQYQELKARHQEMHYRYVDMSDQLAELKYYLPSLQQTEWYEATH